MTPYETRLALAAGPPSVVLKTPDRIARTDVLGVLRSRGHGAHICDQENFVASEGMTKVDDFGLDAEGIHRTMTGSSSLTATSSRSFGPCTTTSELEGQPSVARRPGAHQHEHAADCHEERGARARRVLLPAERRAAMAAPSATRELRRPRRGSGPGRVREFHAYDGPRMREASPMAVYDDRLARRRVAERRGVGGHRSSREGMDLLAHILAMTIASQGALLIGRSALTFPPEPSPATRGPRCRSLGSGSLRPPRATSTSAASARRSSTGSGRGRPAARSSSASRTPTRSAPPTRAAPIIFDSMKWLGLDWDEGPGVGRRARPVHADGAPLALQGEGRRARPREEGLPLLLHEGGARRAARGAQGGRPEGPVQVPGHVPRADRRARPAVRRALQDRPQRLGARTSTRCSARSRRPTSSSRTSCSLRSDGVPALQLRRRRRRHDDGGHARRARPRSHDQHAAADHALRGVRGEGARVRAPPDDARAERREALEAPRTPSSVIEYRETRATRRTPSSTTSRASAGRTATRRSSRRTSSSRRSRGSRAAAATASSTRRSSSPSTTSTSRPSGSSRRTTTRRARCRSSSSAASPASRRRA